MNWRRRSREYAQRKNLAFSKDTERVENTYYSHSRWLTESSLPRSAMLSFSAGHKKIEKPIKHVLQRTFVFYEWP